MENIYQQLKCKKKNHNFLPFTYICMGEQCEHYERLLCTKCAIDHGHSNCYVLIEEILKKDNYSIQNWPQDISGQKVKNLIAWNSRGQAQLQIESLFEEFQQELLNKLQSLKKYLVQQFAFQGENMSKETEVSKSYYDQAYNLKDFKTKLIEFLQEDIDKQDMEDVILQYLRDPERKVALDQAKKASLKLVPNCKFFIDPQQFRDMANKEFYQKIDMLKQSFTGGYNPIDWKLQNSGLYQSKLLKEINQGITFQSQSSNGEEVLFSDQEFSKGVHGFRLRFDSVSENYRCHFLVGLYDLVKTKDEFKPYVCLMCCDHKQCMVPKKNMDFDIHSGSIIDVKANFETYSLEIKEVFSNGSEGAIYISNIKAPENQVQKRKKFFLFFSSSGPHKISLVSSY